MIKTIVADTLSREKIVTCTMPNVTDAVAAILRDVAARGDAALYEYTQRFDQCRLDTLAVTREEIDAAFVAADPVFVEDRKSTRLNSSHVT